MENILHRVGYYAAKAFFTVALIAIGLAPISGLAADLAGAKVQPALIENRIDPGKAASAAIQVTNLSKISQTFYLIKKNISGMDAAGHPIIQDDSAKASGYESADWITSSVSSVLLAPNQSKNIPLVISVPQNASSGGHFALILFSTQAPNVKATGSAVGFEVGTIVSTQVSGNAIDDARLREFRTDKSIYGSADVKFISRVENTGNTLLRANGPLEIQDMFGRTAAVLDINNSQAGVFPKAIREFDAEWHSSGLAFGKYTATLSLAYGPDGNRNTVTSKLSFWILPSNIIWPALIVIVLLILVISLLVRMYIRRKLRALGGASASRAAVSRTPSSFGGILKNVTIIVLAVLVILALLAFIIG